MKNNKVIKIFIAYIIVQVVFASIYYILYKVNNEWYYSNKYLIEAYLGNAHNEKIEEKKELEKKYLSFQSIINDINTFHKYIFSLNQNQLNLKLKNKNLRIDSLDLVAKMIEKSSKMGQNLNLSIYRDIDVQSNILYLIKLKGNILFEFEYGYKSELQKDVLLGSLIEKNKNNVNTINLYKTQIDQIDAKINSLNKRITSKDHSDIWEKIDFLYFAFTFVNSGDIIPNHSVIRLLIITQRISELFLLFLIFNYKKK